MGGNGDNQDDAMSVAGLILSEEQAQWVTLARRGGARGSPEVQLQSWGHGRTKIYPSP
jgi:hypothetical protein